MGDKGMQMLVMSITGQRGLCYGNVSGASPFDKEMHDDQVMVVVMETLNGRDSESYYGLVVEPRRSKVDPPGVVVIRIQLSKRVQVLS
ncbi:hypothetical protein GOP47_0009450 [Adiantum capillus-veneris]|uniref:Uncharacterized protein n=1 Tax=Adiantum capillus-veneris TaxID=13818 RepID=A0A9D4UWW8_ADICA|nr:hypothetical protein GOP47_0009450 [Adiantum capillus-veneris]